MYYSVANAVLLGPRCKRGPGIETTPTEREIQYIYPSMEVIDFIKVDSTVIHFDSIGWLLTAKYNPSTKAGQFACEDLLQRFIRSRYFLWQEKFRDSVSVDINGKDATTDWNFHGLYDAKKLSLSCFEKVDYARFEKRVTDFILWEIGATDQLNKVHNLISQMNNDGNVFYIIKELPDEYLHEWSVFDFFMSALVCNHADETITLLEIGDD